MFLQFVIKAFTYMIEANRIYFINNVNTENYSKFNEMVDFIQTGINRCLKHL